jgi:hypothetical protein
MNRLTAVAVAGVVLALSGCEPPERPLPVTRLSKDYENMARGDRLYKGRVLVVRGRVVASGLTHELMAKEWGVPVNAFFLTVGESDTPLALCLFADEPGAGGWVTVRGRCRGAKVAGRPTLEDCVVLR